MSDDIHCVFDLDFDLTPVSGRRALLEAVARRWLEPRGALVYDADYGGGLSQAIGSFDEDVGALAARLEDEARKDERVRACTVRIERVRERVTIQGRIEDADGPFALTVLVDGLTVQLLMEASR